MNKIRWIRMAFLFGVVLLVLIGMYGWVLPTVLQREGSYVPLVVGLLILYIYDFLSVYNGLSVASRMSRQPQRTLLAVLVATLLVAVAFVVLLFVLLNIRGS